MISYEDLEAKRAEKEAARQARQAKGQGTGKRGQKRKRPEADGPEADGLEADEPVEGEPQLAAKAKQGRKRKSDLPEVERKVKVARMSEVPEPIAPEA